MNGYESDLEVPVVTLCPACSKANPATANYCYYDGRHLSHEGQEGPLRVGTLPLLVPFHFPDGQSCTNFNQLALACDARWDEARGLLADGTWQSFFGTIGRLDLAVAAKQAVKEPDLDVGLSQLLEKFPADPNALRRPQLALLSTEENLGALTPGTDHRFDLMITNRGLLVLRGMVTTNCEWLSFGDGTGPALKMFQTRGIYTLPVRVLGNKLHARELPLQGEIVIDTNGGAIALPVRAVVAVRPFPSGTHANNSLAGARSPREIAVKARAHPQEAAALFEQGAVKAWYAGNGWTYPVQTTQASGKGAVQQFFEALGLTKPPRLVIDTERVLCEGMVGQRLTKRVTISTEESRVVYAQAWSNQNWITVGPGKSQGNKLTIPLLIEVPPRPGETFHADVTIQGNGQQQFVVPVTLAVLAASADVDAKAEVPTGKLPLGWIFAGVGFLLLLAIPVTVVALIVTGYKIPTGPQVINTPPTVPVAKNEAWYADIPNTHLAASVLDLKAIAPEDAAIIDGIGANDEFQRGVAYEKLAAELPKLLGKEEAKEPLGQLVVECCVFEPSDLNAARLLRALTRQIPGKGSEFRPEESGKEPERGRWLLQVIFVALNNRAMDEKHPGRVQKLTRELTRGLEDAFGLAPDEEAPKDELAAQKLLALQCYRNTLPTAMKSLEHALKMRGKLIEMFPKHPSPADRVKVDLELIAIGLSKGIDAWPKLEPIVKTYLEGTDPDIKKKIDDLCKKADPAVAQKKDELVATIRMAALTDKLNNPDSRVRRGAAQTLAEMGSSAKPAVAALAARLRIETAIDVLAELARALGQIRVVTKDAVDALQAKATHTNVTVRLKVIEALLNLGSEAVPVSALFRFMGDDNKDIHKCVDNALTTRFKTPTPEDLRGAIDALKDGDAKVRRQASQALGLCGPAAKEAALPLSKVLQREKDPAVLAAAANSLGLIGSDSTEVLDALGAKANHDDAAVRLAVLQSLTALQGERISLRALFSFAEDRDRDINQRAGTALIKRLKAITEADTPDLRQGLKSKSPATQRTVAEALGRLGKSAEAAADDLVPLLDSSDPLVRIEAAIALVSVNPKHEDAVKKAVPRLVVAFGLQPDEKADAAEWKGRCERARKAVVTLGKPAAKDLVQAIYLGQFNGNKPAQRAARIEVYRTLEKLGAAAKDESRDIAAQVTIDKNYPDLYEPGKRALDAIANSRP